VNLAGWVEQRFHRRLAAYREAPGDVREHAGMEEAVLAGGYGYASVESDVRAAQLRWHQQGSSATTAGSSTASLRCGEEVR